MVLGEEYEENTAPKRRLLHRIVLYDILSNPGMEPHRGKSMPAHLSIPMMPGLETVWAPNGYGKTFAMEVLEKIWKPSKYSQDEAGFMGGVHWLSDFLRECQAMILSISDIPRSDAFTKSRFYEINDKNRTKSWIPSSSERTFPFSLMMARIVEACPRNGVEEVYDLFIKPKWEPTLNHKISFQVSVIKRFHGAALAQRFYEENHSEWLEETDRQLETNSGGKFDRLEPWKFELENSDEEVIEFLKGSGKFGDMFDLHDKDSIYEDFFVPAIPRTYSWDSPRLTANHLSDDEIATTDGNMKDPVTDALRQKKSEKEPKEPSSFDLFNEETKTFKTNFHLNHEIGLIWYESKEEEIDGVKLEIWSRVERNFDDIGHRNSDQYLPNMRATSTENRQPPHPNIYFSGRGENLHDAPDEIQELLEVIRGTRIEYLEIPKESLRFFENIDKMDSNVRGLISEMSDSEVKLMEERINNVLMANGEQDPWAREVVFRKKGSDKKRVEAEFELEIGDYYIATPPSSQTRPLYISNLILPLSEEMTESSKRELESSIKTQKTYTNMLKRLAIKRQEDFQLSATAVVKELESLNLENGTKKGETDVSQQSDARGMIEDMNEASSTLDKSLMAYKKAAAVVSFLEGMKSALDEATPLVKTPPIIYEEGEEIHVSTNRYVSVDRIDPDYIRGIIDKLVDISALDVNRPWWPAIEADSSIPQSDEWDAVSAITENIPLESFFRGEAHFGPHSLENPIPHRLWVSKLEKALLIAEAPIGIGRATFDVKSPYYAIPLAKDVLSFGQKSTILTELFLGAFESISLRPRGETSPDRMCLVIDEPEVGRSEHSLSLLIERLRESKGNMEEHRSPDWLFDRSGLDNSIIVLSHRNSLLKEVSGRYHLMQPFDPVYYDQEEE